MSRLVAAATGFLAVLFLVSCGANKNAAGPTTTTPPLGASPTMTSEWTSSSTAASSESSSEARLGCGTFCQNAGGYGGAGDKPTSFAVTVDTNEVTLDPDGYVPLTVTCHLPVQCNGVLIVFVMSQGYNPLGGGRSDLVVDAGATRTIGVEIDSTAADYIRSHGSTGMDVTADARNSGLSDADAGMAMINLSTELMVAAP